MPRRLAATALAVTAALGLAACGEEHEVTEGHTEAIYVTVDDLKYQVQISRILNPDDTEDQSYLKGIADPGERELEGEEEWFGVFLRVESPDDNDTPRRTASDVTIEDTTGAEFEPVGLDPQQTPLAYAPTELSPGEESPGVGGIAQTTSTAGSLLLFKIPRDNLENRPLELTIKGGISGRSAHVNLDV